MIDPLPKELAPGTEKDLHRYHLRVVVARLAFLLRKLDMLPGDSQVKFWSREAKALEHMLHSLNVDVAKAVEWVTAQRSTTK